MSPDLRKELNSLKANLRYYKDLVASHPKHVDVAVKGIATAKQTLQDILDRRERAPSLIKTTENRINLMKVEIAKTPFSTPVDPRVKKMIALKDKLRRLEEDLGI